jgi:hypothetical protein
LRACAKRRSVATPDRAAGVEVMVRSYDRDHAGGIWGIREIERTRVFGINARGVTGVAIRPAVKIASGFAALMRDEFFALVCSGDVNGFRRVVRRDEIIICLRW